MTVRNILLTLAKRKKFDKELFIEKLVKINGLNEKQWKDNCFALIEQITRILRGRNIAIGRYITKYEKMLNEQKDLCDSNLKSFYKKEINRLKKEKQKENLSISIKDAIDMLSMEGYQIKKEGTAPSNDMMLNVLKYHFTMMDNDAKKKFLQKINEYFLQG